MADVHWHALDTAQVAARLQVDPCSGLDEAEAVRRLASSGPNRMPAPAPPSLSRVFMRQLLQPLVVVLILAGMLTAALGHGLDAGVIFAVVLVNALVGLVQEDKAEAALAALARAVATRATVLRGGRSVCIDAAQLVPGDLVSLSAGDKVPADLRLYSARALQTREAHLTGESLPVPKHMATLPAETGLADRHNMLYAGTLVVTGQGRGIVVATGGSSATGHIARLIAQRPPMSTPLTRQINTFTRRLLIAILALTVLGFVVGVWRAEPPLDMFMAAVALAVGAIPEGLPAAMSVTLAIGMKRMARRQAIVRRLAAVETLGSTTVICSDKTGTLTENAMIVREIWAGGEAFTVTGHGYDPAGHIEQAGIQVPVSGALLEALRIAALCNDARLVHEGPLWSVAGDPTEGALLVAARKGGLDDSALQALFARLDELPFDASHPYMATVHDFDGVRVMYLKGAMERLLPGCVSMLDATGAHVAFDAERVQAAATRMTSAGWRVLALARSPIGASQRLDPECINKALVFVGLAGMLDPPRPRALNAVRACRAAGVRVKMITGDHPGTALSIARQLAIAGESSVVLTGRELAALDDTALQAAASRVDVFARVEPWQKLNLVRALQASGEVVAMTGDGVNDAPALRQADIGIAMGQDGSEVAREAAALVLTDDNFATIEAAIEQGRGIYDNLVRFITWTLPTNAGEGLVILTAILVGTALPITPLQILWINLTTSILLGMPLAFEPVEPGVMQRPPRPPGQPVLEQALLWRIVLVSVLMTAGAFGLFEVALQHGHSMEQARTVACNVFVCSEMAYLFNCRTLTRPCWAAGAAFSLRSNPWPVAGAGTMLGLQLAFTYWPPLNRLFQSAPIGLTAWLWIAGAALLCAALAELDKARQRHAARRRALPAAY